MTIINITAEGLSIRTLRLRVQCLWLQFEGSMCVGRGIPEVLIGIVYGFFSEMSKEVHVTYFSSGNKEIESLDSAQMAYSHISY